VSQETLAEMAGTTRSRVNFFLNKFRKLGFIEYNGGLKRSTTLSSASCCGIDAKACAYSAAHAASVGWCSG
jgi:Crp-like helix-turn-helix domain